MAVGMLAGCEGSPTEAVPAGVLEVTPDQPAYTVGSLASFTVHNPTSQPVSLLVCDAYRVERLLFGMWVPVPREPSIALCAVGSIPVQPGQSLVEQVKLKDDDPAGTYRVVFVEVTDGQSAQREDPSRPFEVRR